MPNIQTDADITRLNTFGLPATAAGLCRVSSAEQLAEVCADPRFDGQPQLVLGGGSNLVFVDDYPGLIIQPDWHGINIESENDTSVTVTIGASEPWDKLVRWSTAHGLYGLENLAAIPGWCGAAPMQNIGAYGAEFSDVCVSVSIIEMSTGTQRDIDAADCGFAYRDSIFKTGQAQDWLVTGIRIRLQHQSELKLDYPGVREALRERNIQHPSPTDMANVITHIRQRKLPDPATIGNAGSFFKNPVVPQAVAEGLRSQSPSAPCWPVPDSDDGRVKLSAAWLIEQCGWKGQREGPVGVHREHALVLVHYGGGNGRQLLRLARSIQQDVNQRFGIELQPEPKLIQSP